MLFRDYNGNIIQINKNDFLTDNDYYKKIAEIYDINIENKKENSKNKIMDFIKKKR
jgi:hypothetical protein